MTKLLLSEYKQLLWPSILVKSSWDTYTRLTNAPDDIRAFWFFSIISHNNVPDPPSHPQAMLKPTTAVFLNVSRILVNIAKGSYSYAEYILIYLQNDAKYLELLYPGIFPNIF